MNRKGQTNTDIEKKKQNMHGMHRYQAKREERMRTEACEGMLLNMPVTLHLSTFLNTSMHTCL
jgi:hypothetical protein